MSLAHARKTGSRTRHDWYHSSSTSSLSFSLDGFLSPKSVLRFRFSGSRVAATPPMRFAPSHSRFLSLSLSLSLAREESTVSSSPNGNPNGLQYGSRRTALFLPLPALPPFASFPPAAVLPYKKSTRTSRFDHESAADAVGVLDFPRRSFVQIAGPALPPSLPPSLPRLAARAASAGTESRPVRALHNTPILENVLFVKPL